MGIATTTPPTIRASLVAAIEAMTPSTTEHQSVGWRYLIEGRVTGHELRTFTIHHSPAIEDLDGIHGGDGIGYTYDTRIRVAYGGIPGDLADALIWADGKDLWLLIHPLPDGGAGAIPGLLPFRDGYTIEFYDEEEGSLIVDFVIPTYFKASDS